ncbi:MAG: lipopolysaccharide biosynthesis protein [Syntrophorhabdaceae bacterium]|nr:lipopolysaccharide biosynthesis protein [Syntrophorhabdaceae bacterium]
MNTESVTDKATRSVKWSALMEVVSRTASPIILIILARLLTPDDFGVVATAMISISFAQMFWDAGLSKALIQTKEAPEDVAHVVFWTNIFLGVLIYGILFILAPAIALFFNSPASGPVLRVLGFQIVIASFSSVQQALFVRDLAFRNLFWIKLLTAFIPGLCSIPLAIFGYGVWALVAGSLAGQALNCWLLWRRSAWRPKITYNKELARKLFSFGFWVLLESFAAWLIIWGDNLIVGRFLGVHDLGVYQTGWMLVTILFGLTLNPFLPVLYSTFSRLQDDLPALKNTFHKVNRVVMALALPMGVGLLLVGPELADLLFGNKWQGLGFVVSVIGFMMGLGWIVGINAELYRAMGRPDVNTKLMFVAILYYLPAYYVASQFGLKTFVITRLVVALVAIPIHIYLCTRMLGFPSFYLWYAGKNIILATLFMGIIVAILKSSMKIFMPDLQNLLTLPLLIITGIIVYAGSLWLKDRSFIIQIKGQLMRAVQS